MSSFDIYARAVTGDQDDRGCHSPARDRRPGRRSAGTSGLDSRRGIVDDPGVVRVFGTIDGQPVAGVVRDGVLVGDRALMQRVEEMIAWKVRVGLGPWSAQAGLDDARAAYMTLRCATDCDATTRLDAIPPLPVETVPYGAES